MTEIIHTETRDGLLIKVLRHPEFLDPADHYLEKEDVEIIEKIDNGTYDWFMLEVTASFNGRVIADEFLGCCCYENANDVLNDCTAEELINDVMFSAKQFIATIAEEYNYANAQR